MKGLIAFLLVVIIALLAIIAWKLVFPHPQPPSVPPQPPSIIDLFHPSRFPNLLTARKEAHKKQCANNLKQIYPAAATYADKKYEFPRDKTNEEPTAHDSLNILLKSRHAKHLLPTVFTCPAGEAAEPENEEDEDYFLLDEDTLDYAWANVSRRPTGKVVPIASDKYYKGYDPNREGHDGLIHVLMSDGTVEEWEINSDGECPDHENEFDVDEGLPVGLGR